jgi:hypothetical protein
MSKGLSNHMMNLFLEEHNSQSLVVYDYRADGVKRQIEYIFIELIIERNQCEILCHLKSSIYCLS